MYIFKKGDIIRLKIPQQAIYTSPRFTVNENMFRAVKNNYCVIERIDYMNKRDDTDEAAGMKIEGDICSWNWDMRDFELVNDEVATMPEETTTATKPNKYSLKLKAVRNDDDLDNVYVDISCKDELREVLKKCVVLTGETSFLSPYSVISSPTRYKVKTWIWNSIPTGSTYDSVKNFVFSKAFIDSGKITLKLTELQMAESIFNKMSETIKIILENTIKSDNLVMECVFKEA